MTIKTIGLDLAKSIFQAHGVGESGATMLVKKLHRKQMLPFSSKLPLPDWRRGVRNGALLGTDAFGDGP